MSLFHIFIYFPTFPLPAPGFVCLRGRGPRKGENNQTYENKTDLCKAQRRTNEKGIRTKMENKKNMLDLPIPFFPQCIFFRLYKKNSFFIFVFFVFLLFHRQLLDFLFCFARPGRQKRGTNRKQRKKAYLCKAKRGNIEKCCRKTMKHVRVGVANFNSSFYLDAILLFPFFGLTKIGLFHMFHIFHTFRPPSPDSFFFLRGRGAKKEEKIEIN